MDAVSGFFTTLYYVFIAAPCVIGLMLGGAKLVQGWSGFNEKERFIRSMSCGVLIVIGIIAPVAFHIPFMVAWMTNLLPLLLLLPVAGWLFYIFAVTKLGQQLDQSSDDIHAIAQKNSPL